MELTQAELDAKIKEGVDAATAKLVDKRDELLGKVSNLSKEVKALSKKDEDLSTAVEQAKLEANKDYEGLVASLKKSQEKELKKLTDINTAMSEKLTDSDGTLRKLLVDNGLTKSFLDAGVKDPNFLEACIALNAPNAVIEKDENDNPIVKIEGKVMSEFIEEWKGGKGKAFIKFGNSGGNANGNDGDDKDGAEAYFKPGDTYNATKQLALKTTDPARYETLSKKYATSNKPLPLNAQGIR